MDFKLYRQEKYNMKLVENRRFGISHRLFNIRLDSNTVDASLLMLMFLQLVILEFFGLGQLLNKITSVLILLRLISIYKHKIFNSKAFLIALGIIILFILSVIFSVNFQADNVKINFLLLIYPLMYVLYIFFIFRDKPKFISSLIEKSFILFNIVFIVNIIVMIIQIIYPYSINAVADTTDTPEYFDLISGLFQYSSTHNVSIFTAFIIVYNLTFFKRLKVIWKKILLFIYILVSIVASVIISLFNDNKALFLLLPFVLLIYIVISMTVKNSAKKFITLLTICIILIIAIFLYIINPIVQKFVDENILNLLKLINESFTLGSEALGSNERIAIIGQALSSPSTWFFGNGFATVPIYSNGYLGYSHFGQSDFGSLLTLGGIWFVIANFVYYIYIFRKIINSKKISVVVGLVLLLLLISIYTQCFSRTNTITCLVLLMMAYRMSVYI